MVLMTLTREQIEAMLAANKRTQYAIAAVTTNEVVALGELALEGLALRAENERLTKDRDAEQKAAKNLYITLSGALEEAAALRAENERLRVQLGLEPTLGAALERKEK